MLSQQRDIKIIISSDPQGRLQQLLPKIAALHQKNNFNFMLMNGNVCDPRMSSFIKKIKQKQTSIPLPIYFIDNSKFSPVLYKLHEKGTQVVQNFIYLGNIGLKTINGINIAYISQVSDQNIDKLIVLCKNVTIDILITNSWTNQILKISNLVHQSSQVSLSKLLQHLSPKYHLAAGGSSFYRSPPYLNNLNLISHFINVAEFKQVPNDKYLFAITLRSNHQDKKQDFPNCISNPYQNRLQNIKQQKQSHQTVLNTKRQRTHFKNAALMFEGFPDWARNQEISQFLQRWGQINHIDCFKDKKGGKSGSVKFCEQKSAKQCLKDSGKFMFHSNRIKFYQKQLKSRIRIQDCWFCKDGGQKQLVVYEGRFVYLSLQKGPISKYHLQIIPYSHVSSTGKLDPSQRQELEHIKNRLAQHFGQKQYKIISYQRCLLLNQAVNHCVVHFIPVKCSYSLLASFNRINKQDFLGFRQQQNIRRSQYFVKLQIQTQSYLKQVSRKDKVQIDFVRQIICQILKCPQKTSWKNCERALAQLNQEKHQITNQLAECGIINQ